MIIDVHAHIYPEKIAEKATVAIGSFYGIKMSMKTGTAEQLLEIGKRANVDKYIVHSVATKKEQVSSINNFIIDECDKHKEFIGFMTLHQDLDFLEIESQVKYCKEKGIKGIKLHPDFQKFNIDDKNVYKIYEVASHFDMPILFHTGDDRFNFSKPFRLVNVAKDFKNLRLIGAHFGAYRCWESFDDYVGFDNIYFDTSSSLSFINKNMAKSMIDKAGVDRFFFGSDFPMWNAKDEIKKVRELGLNDSDLDKIFYKNILSFLKLN